MSEPLTREEVISEFERCCAHWCMAETGKKHFEYILDVLRKSPNIGLMTLGEFEKAKIST